MGLQTFIDGFLNKHGEYKMIFVKVVFGVAKHPTFYHEIDQNWKLGLGTPSLHPMSPLN